MPLIAADGIVPKERYTTRAFLDAELDRLWPRAGRSRAAERRFFADWRARNWGELTTQDYENLTRVQAGMRSRGFTGLRLNPRQESNLLHMHRVIDRYPA